MSDLKKIEQVVQSPVYLAYSQLIGAAIARMAMGDPSAKTDLLDLQREQAQVVTEALNP